MTEAIQLSLSKVVDKVREANVWAYADDLDNYYEEEEYTIYRDKVALSVADHFQEDIGDKLKTAIEKYGIGFDKFVFYNPHDGYKAGSVDVRVTMDHTTSEFNEKHKKELKGLIDYYITNVRVESYDGYMSLEPTAFKDVERDDYCVLWAIIENENLVDDIHEAFETLEENTTMILHENSG